MLLSSIHYPPLLTFRGIMDRSSTFDDNRSKGEKNKYNIPTDVRETKNRSTSTKTNCRCLPIHSINDPYHRLFLSTFCSPIRSISCHATDAKKKIEEEGNTAIHPSDPRDAHCIVRTCSGENIIK